jgi:hypothetical protein
MCAREEREGVTGGATDRRAEERQNGGQNERGGGTDEKGACTRVRARACKEERQEVKCDRLVC